jgi:hypothetical protein
MGKQRVLVDTCVIIEAFRINCWKALCAHFDVETVECCVTECNTGDPSSPGRVNIPLADLTAGLNCVHKVDAKMLATLYLDCPNLPALDDGELHLFAWLHANPKEAVLTILSTSDRAAIRAAHVLEFLDRVHSLHSIAKTASVGPRQLGNLKDHFCEEWLSSARFKIVMGQL